METYAETTMESKMDAWVQRISLMAMVALALSLLGVGVALYAPRAQAEAAPPGVGLER